MIENVIDIEGVIGWEVTARDVKRQLADMGDVDEIQVNINSPGGYIDDGFGIYTALVNHPATIHTHVTGMAASMASVLARAGDTTTIEPTGMFMIHPPSSIVWGTAVDMRKGADVLDKCETRLVKAYNRRDLNIDADELAESIAAETWYTSDEAVAAGFADSVSEGGEQSIDEGAANNALAWMKVAAFKNAPDNVAESFGFYKTQNINNAATKKMVKALAQDGSAVETTEGKKMTEQVTVSEADVDQAVKENNDKWTALMSHERGGNREAVAKVMSFGMSLEKSLEMMDLVEPVENAVETAEPETDESVEKGATLAEIKEMLAVSMSGSEVNNVNTNAGTQEGEGAGKPEFDPKAEYNRLTGAA